MYANPEIRTISVATKAMTCPPARGQDGGGVADENAHADQLGSARAGVPSA